MVTKDKVHLQDLLAYNGMRDITKPVATFLMGSNLDICIMRGKHCMCSNEVLKKQDYFTKIMHGVLK